MIYPSYRRADSPFPIGPIGPFREHLQANAWLRREMGSVPTAELGCIHDQGKQPRITILARAEVLGEES